MLRSTKNGITRPRLRVRFRVFSDPRKFSWGAFFKNLTMRYTVFKINLPETKTGLRQFRLIRSDFSLNEIKDISTGFRASGLILDFKNGVGRIENFDQERAKFYNNASGVYLRMVNNACRNGHPLFN